jgi:hypothetical protein
MIQNQTTRAIQWLLLLPAAALLLGASARPAVSGEILERREGGVIEIDISGSDQLNSAVAYASRQGLFLVVYESMEPDYDIYGRFVEAETGNTLGTRFPIAATGAWELNPDVAYDPYNDRFLVVWQHLNASTLDSHISGRVVYGRPLPGPIYFPDSSTTILGAGPEQTYKPAVAHNTDDHQFMVVFEESGGGIKGRMAEINPAYTGHLNEFGLTNFELRSLPGHTIGDPDLAWTSQQSRFFAVWEETSNTGEYDILGQPLYDTYQSSGNQIVYTSISTVGEDAANGYDCRDPSVAYDPLRDYFLSVFTHKTGTGSSAPTEIRGSGVTAYGFNTSNAFIDIETSIGPSSAYHHAPRIAYSGIAGMMHVVYLSVDENDPGADYTYLKQRSFWFDSYTDEHVSNWMTVQVSGADEGIWYPSIAGSHNGRSLVAWRDYYDVGDWDIHARRIAPYWVHVPVFER